MLWLKNLPLYRKFQSTPPARGATNSTKGTTINIVFQSTPPARGATFPEKSCIFIDEVFQSTPPARGAT